MRANRHLALRGLAAALFLTPAGAGAAPQPCTPESARTFRGAWVRAADQTSGASDDNLAKGELAAILKQMDRFGTLVEQAVMPLEGFTGAWHKIVGYEPLFKGGPVVQEIRGRVETLQCKDGKLRQIRDGGEPGLEVNWLWSNFSNTSIEIGGRRVHLLNYPLGDVRGYPLTEHPYVASYSGDVHLLRWSVLVTARGKLPFRYVTRREYLAFARGFVEERRKKDALMWRSSLAVRPAAEQEAEKQRELGKIDREGNAGRREKQRARYLAEYRTDEEKIGDAVRKSEAFRDAHLARLAAVERSLTPAQLDEPAILEGGQVSPESIAADWAFSTDLKTDRTHVCTFECRHGQHLVVVDESYFDRTLPRRAPQLFAVVFAWPAGVSERYRNPVAEAVRDAFLARLDFDALAALLPGSGGVGKPGPALRGLPSGDTASAAPGAAQPAPAAVASPAAARPTGIRAPAPPPPRAPAPPADAADNLATYEGVIAEGDRLFDDGDYHNAVRAYERAWRVAYRGKLATDKAALDARLEKARAARDAGRR